MKQFIKIVMTILICVGIGVSVTYLFREIDMQSSQMSLMMIINMVIGIVMDV